MTLYDPGLQPERTELAWRRTALAIAVGSLAGMRVLPMLLGSPLWIIAGVIGLSVAAILWRAARSRYHAVYNALHPVEDTAALRSANSSEARVMASDSRDLERDARVPDGLTAIRAHLLEHRT